MDRVERPLSPHITIYRPQITSVLSILHRGTGIVLSVGAPVLTYWLIALAGGPEAYADAQWLFGSGFFLVLALGWTFCFFYHLANGIRHLVWDTGLGFDHHQYRASGWTVVAVSVLATLIYFIVAVL
jgi:succinate dehydrogenase / fumarate reductase, cytochrome b subunit